MSKVLGLGTLFIMGVCLADLVTHSTGTAALGTASNNLLKTGSGALLGVSNVTPG
jgi:hypothetical protein